MQRQRFKNELHVFSVKNILALQMQRQHLTTSYKTVNYITVNRRRLLSRQTLAANMLRIKGKNVTWLDECIAAL